MLEFMCSKYKLWESQICMFSVHKIVVQYMKNNIGIMWVKIHLGRNMSSRIPNDPGSQNLWKTFY